MRFSQTTRNGRQADNKPNIGFTKYLKLVIWFSISCYLFSSLIGHKSITSLPKTTLSQPKTTRALSESLNTTVLKHSRPPQGLLKDLKVYVYDLPAKYNGDWLANERCSNHLFAAEVAIHRALLNSDLRTLDPWEADFFFVPVYVSCNFSTVNGFPAIGHARSLISSAIQLISWELPFWNRSLGSDHVFVASHDFGACFHTLEDVAIADGVPEFLKNSVILQTFGVKYQHPCQEVENVVIPPYVSPESIRSNLLKHAATARRDIFAFFRGKMEIHPKNVSGRFYSKRVRTAIWQKYSGDRRFYLKRQRFAGYKSEIVRSVFCLCPLGWAPWSPRLVESVVLGCVPVIIADGIRLPFPAAVRWPEISLTVAEKDVGKLGAILTHVAATNLTTIQSNLMDPAKRRALLFHDSVQEGDASWQVLHALSLKLHRSHRRSRLPNKSGFDT
ncbi:probable glucuronoxylan glucuronosyltransferase IRX7 [Diospyros lotus]|uniref:probable glucuronoxylan glucuronosyltransferase IRX7 n=1 Tax=Diospyros lotus TaxID=55363 RepID=UPI00225B5131|nr:probable glucuronoxylan glucuronosyltransferase IRX7 [Diospyros lotus]